MNLKQAGAVALTGGGVVCAVLVARLATRPQADPSTETKPNAEAAVAEAKGSSGPGARTSVDAQAERSPGTPSREAVSTPEPETPATRFARAKERLENNLGDAIGANESDLLGAIEEIRATLADGLEDRKSAFKALAEGYRAVAFMQVPDYGPKHWEYVKRAAEAYRQVIELDPMDTGARLSYAVMVRDDELALAQVQEAVRRTPSHAGAHYSLGAILMKRGRANEAVAAYERALSLTDDPYYLERKGDEIVNDLRYYRLEADADRIERWLAARKQARQDGGEGER